MTKQTIFTRRNLLGGLLAGGAAAAAYAKPGLFLNWAPAAGRRGRGSWWTKSAVPLARAGIDDWGAQVGTVFKVAGETGNAALKLVSVLPFQSAGRRPASLGRDRAFAAVFEPVSGPVPAGDRTYSVQHETNSALSIFITPRPGSEGRLEAVFN